MALVCSVFGHHAGSVHHRNQGLDFAACHHCGCDLIREGEADWTPVPKGFRVVWRKLGQGADPLSVASRMAHYVPPARRDRYSGRTADQRDGRGRPLTGAASMIGLLAQLNQLVRDSGAALEPDRLPESSGRVIRLPANH